MPPNPQPETLRRLVELLTSAFDRGELTQVLQLELNETLANVVATDGSFAELVFDLVQWAGRHGRHGRLEPLAEALARARPGRADLQEVVRSLRGELNGPLPGSPTGSQAPPGRSTPVASTPRATGNPASRLPSNLESAAEAPDPRTHQVFLSYNSAHRADVVRVAEWLESRGITTWFDQWDLLPGDLAQVEMARALEQVPVVVICLGPTGQDPTGQDPTGQDPTGQDPTGQDPTGQDPTGLGPWQSQEMEAAIARRVSQSPPLRIIPLLLPGTASTPNVVPLFLRGTIWARWQTEGEFEPVMQQLQRGIEGRPRAVARAAQYSASGSAQPVRWLLALRLNARRLSFGTTRAGARSLGVRGEGACYAARVTGGKPAVAGAAICSTSSANCA
jgi:hypothetical protein